MNRLLYIMAFAAVLGVADTAAAQLPKTGTIAGNGTAEIKRQPQFLRVQIEVLAKGKDVKDALAKLKERRDTIKLQLGKLDAVQDTVAFGEPALGGEKTDQQRRMEMMVTQRLRAGGKTPAKAKPAAAIVTLNLKFDVPVKAADIEEFLIVSQQLQTKIKEADLAGLKEYQKLTPQEEELAEEAKLAESMNGQEEVKKGEPSFFFVCKLTEAELAKATAEAFAKAKQEATQLAAAAGVDLGALHHLEGQNQAGGDDEIAFGRYNQYGARNQAVASTVQSREAVSMRPGLVTYRVGVAALFQVKAK